MAAGQQNSKTFGSYISSALIKEKKHFDIEPLAGDEQSFSNEVLIPVLCTYVHDRNKAYSIKTLQKTHQSNHRDRLTFPLKHPYSSFGISDEDVFWGLNNK